MDLSTYKPKNSKIAKYLECTECGETSWNIILYHNTEVYHQCQNCETIFKDDKKYEFNVSIVETKEKFLKGAK